MKERESPRGWSREALTMCSFVAEKSPRVGSLACYRPKQGRPWNRDMTAILTFAVISTFLSYFKTPRPEGRSQKEICPVSGIVSKGHQYELSHNAFPAIGCFVDVKHTEQQRPLFPAAFTTAYSHENSMCIAELKVCIPDFQGAGSFARAQVLT